jgi:hypothetical protein
MEPSKLASARRSAAPGSLVPAFRVAVAYHVPIINSLAFLPFASLFSPSSLPSPGPSFATASLFLSFLHQFSSHSSHFFNLATAPTRSFVGAFLCAFKLLLSTRSLVPSWPQPSSWQICDSLTRFPRAAQFTSLQLQLLIHKNIFFT